MKKASRHQGNVTIKADEHEQTSTIWPEWSDVEVNATKWDLGDSKSKSKSKKSARKTPPDLEEPPQLFEDEAGILIMPSYMIVNSWIRPQQFFPDNTCLIVPENHSLDLISQNTHLMQYELMRQIIASIMCLEREASLRPFPVEFQNPKFIANGGPYWKPWHHVYAHSKVGKGSTHNMRYNSYGKYIVRLFYLGKWRQITVDDIFPVDENNQILLPCSKTQSNIWLPILSKALIRVAARTQFLEFSVIHCLTGWMYTHLNPRNVSPFCLWYICCQLMPTTQEVTGPPGCCKHESVTCLPDSTLEQNEAVGSRTMFAHISNITEVEPSLAGLTPCWDHLLLISSARFNDEEPNPRWKEYRWKEWAFNKGLISDIKPKPVRNVNLFCPFQKRKSEIIEEPTPAVSTKLSSPKKKGSAKSKKSPSSRGSKKSEKSKSKKSDLGKLEDTIEEEKEWIDFDLLVKYLMSIYVFYKPSFFEFQLNAFSIPELSAFQAQSKVATTGKPETAKPKKTSSITSSKKDKSKSSKKNELTKKSGPKDKEISEKSSTSDDSSHHCFYFISDSQYCKTFYISASGSGENNEEVIEDPFYIVGESFNWRSKNLGEIIFVFKSNYLKSIVLKLEPGLQVLRIWYHFPKNFSFHIYSNTPFTTCLKSRMQELLACDSETFSYYGEQISNHFNLLLDSPIGGQEHGEAYTNFVHSFNPPYMTKQLQWPYWFTAELDLQDVFEESIIEMIINTEVTPSEEFFKTMEAFKIILLSPKFGEKTLESLSEAHLSFFHLRRLSKEQKQMMEEIAKSVKQTSSSKKKGKGTAKPAKSPKSPKSSSSSKSADSSKKKGKSVKADTLIKCIEVPVESLILTNPENAKQLMRLMLHKLPPLLKYYPLKTDDVNHLSFCDYDGEGKAHKNWVLFCRCSMNVHTSSPTPCSFHVLAPVRNVTIRIIDLDSLQEISVGTSENPVCLLSQNKDGYLVCIYGTLQTPYAKDFPWKLRIIGESNADLLHLCTLNETGNCGVGRQLPPQSLQYVKGYYIPNRCNIIGRCLLKVTTEESVSLRLVLSSDKVQCSFKMLDEVGEVIAYAEGVGDIILPIVNLKGPSDGKDEIVYEIEIKLLNNSWSLSGIEKVACYLMKEKLQDHNDDNVSEISQHKGSFSSRIQSFVDEDNKCFWEIILVSNQQKILPVRLLPDTRLVEKLHQYIPDWSIDHWSRLKTGQVHRSIFYTTILMEDRDRLSYLESKSIEDLFNFSPVKTTAMLQMYDEPLFEIPDDQRASSENTITSFQSLSYSLENQPMSLESETTQIPQVILYPEETEIPQVKLDPEEAIIPQVKLDPEEAIIPQVKLDPEETIIPQVKLDLEDTQMHEERLNIEDIPTSQNEQISKSETTSTPQLTHAHMMRWQKKVLKTLAQYSQKEKEDCARQMEEAYKIREQSIADLAASRRKDSLLEKPVKEKTKKTKKK